MLIMILLAGLGLCLGSFVNALVWRVHRQKDFVRGRSQCVHCGHELAAADLVPVISWLSLRGRCRYCRKPISRQYPLVELVMAIIFIFSYAFWPGGVNTPADWLQLTTWLAASVGLLALLVYDARWMLLPNKILYPTLAVAFYGRALYIGGFESHPFRALGAWLLSVLIASGFFWVLFQVSKGKWIGYGDVRLGLLTGTLLADPLQALLMILLASVLGAALALPLLASGRKRMTEKLAFGPFLIISTGLVLLFGDQLIDWYRSLLMQT